MPLYDFVVMVKPAVDRRGLVDLMKRLGERVYSRNGVVTNIKSFGRVNLAYGIKKRDGRFFEFMLEALMPLSSLSLYKVHGFRLNVGQMMQMSIMVPPEFPKELNFLNKDEKLLRWMLIKNRGNNWAKFTKET